VIFCPGIEHEIRQERRRFMSFERMSISLPAEMRKYVERQVETRGFAGASEYFRELIRAELARAAKREVMQNIPSRVPTSPEAIRRPLASAARR
jgi:Arc/MetJ-type ribon-helix-helix transcriptional regulator